MTDPRITLTAVDNTKAAFSSVEGHFNRLRTGASALRTSFAALGASLAGGAFVGFLKSGIDAGDEFNKLSQKVGVAVESLSALNYAAKLSDLSTEQLASGLTKLSRTASEAGSGTGDAADAFKAIGVSVKDSQGQLRGTEDLLLTVAERFSGMADSSQKTALAMKIFGKSGAELIPFLNQGRDGIEGLRKEAERLGIIMSTETARAAEEFNDNLTRLQTRTDKLKFALAESLLPTLSRVAEQMAEAARNGEGFLGILKSLTALSPFDDLQRASKELSEQVGEQLSIENELARRSGKAGSDEIAALNERLSATKTRIVEVKKLLGVLRGETNAFGDPLKTDKKPKGNAPGISSGADALALLRAKSEQELKRIADAAKDEQEAVGGSLEILQQMYGRNLIGIKAYYDERARLAEQSRVAAIKAAQDEIDVLRRTRDALPKGSQRTEIDAKIEASAGKIEEANRKFAQSAVLAASDASLAMEKYGDSIKAAEADLLELQGEIRKAAEIRIGLQNKDLARQAAANGDENGQRIVAALKSRATAQAEINALLQDAQIIQDKLGNAEARINIARGQGLSGELTSLQETGTARQAAVQQLRAISEAYTEIANQQGNPVLKQQAENFKRQVDELAASADLVRQKFRQIGEDGLSQFFTDVLDGTKSVKDAFADMARSILRSVNQLVAQDIAKKIFGSFSGSSSGGGGIIGGIASFFGSFFGRASGGPAMAGVPQWVGEQGKELFVPSVNGTIVPHDRIGTSGGGMVVNQYFSFPGQPASRETQGQIANAAARGLETWRGRNG